MQLPDRADVALQTTWDLASIFATDSDWEKAFVGAEYDLPTLAPFRGTLNTPQAVAAFFATSEALAKRVSHVGVYASLGYSVDTQDMAASARSDRAQGLSARFSAAVAFAEPELLAQGEAGLKTFADSPELAGYKHYFERLLLRAPHVRSGEVEQVLSMARESQFSAARIHGILTDADLSFSPAKGDTGHEFEIGQGTIGKLLTDPDRAVRKSAWENYADSHLSIKNGLAQCLSTGVKQNVFTARVRGYESPLHAALTPNFIPVSVFENLITAFQKNLPTWHRYWNLRKRALNLEQLAPWDVKAPLTGSMPDVSYAQSVEWIADGMAPLGQEYVEILKRGSLAERWVDVYPNRGKRMGAFSSGTVGTHPFILMSYNDDLFSLSTLAHELGHSLHSHYSRREQPQHYAGYGLFVAEVASNFNQALVRAHLLERFQGDKNFEIALIEEAMSNFHRYFFVMPTLARFEREIHERAFDGEALTASSLTNLMADLFTEGFGPGVETNGKTRERIGSTWMQFSTHMYSNFYVYQYATGISGAHALANHVLTGGPDAAEKYLGFLKAGGSKFPLDALRDAGVDLATSAPVDETFAVLASYVDRLETLLA